MTLIVHRFADIFFPARRTSDKRLPFVAAEAPLSHRPEPKADLMIPNPDKCTPWLLGLTAPLVLAIGGALLLAPHAMHRGNGVDLGSKASLAEIPS